MLGFLSSAGLGKRYRRWFALLTILCIIAVGLLDLTVFKSRVSQIYQKYINYNVTDVVRKDVTIDIMHDVNSAKVAEVPLACKVPQTDPYAAEIKQYISYSKPKVCPGKPPMTYVDGGTLRINRTAFIFYNVTRADCEYQAVRMTGYGTDRVKFTQDVRVKHDFIRVKCFSPKNRTQTYVNFHAFIHTKPETEKRCKKVFYDCLLIFAKIFWVKGTRSRNRI